MIVALDGSQSAGWWPPCRRLVRAAPLLLAVGMAPRPVLRASVQDAPPAADACHSLTGSLDQVAATLSTVPRYGATYVLVLSPRVGADVTSLDASALKTVEVAVHDGTAGAAMVQAKGLKPHPYPLDRENLTRPIVDLLGGGAQAAVLWAPLAALGIDRLDPDGTLRMVNAGGPEPPPAVLAAASTGAPNPCAVNIAGLIEANGVVPAELLIPADIRRLIGRPPPARDTEAVRQRGTLSEPQIAAIYQYVRARSQGDLGPNE